MFRPTILPPGSSVRSTYVKPAGHREVISVMRPAFTCREDTELLGRIRTARRLREQNIAQTDNPSNVRGQR